MQERGSILQSTSRRPTSHVHCIFLYGDGASQALSDRQRQKAVPFIYSQAVEEAITSSDAVEIDF